MEKEKGKERRANGHHATFFKFKAKSFSSCAYKQATIGFSFFILPHLLSQGCQHEPHGNFILMLPSRIVVITEAEKLREYFDAPT